MICLPLRRLSLAQPLKTMKHFDALAARYIATKPDTAELDTILQAIEARASDTDSHASLGKSRTELHWYKPVSEQTIEALKTRLFKIVEHGTGPRPDDFLITIFW